MRKSLKEKLLTVSLLSISLLMSLSGCSDVSGSAQEDIDYKEEMRDFVEDISAYAKSFDDDFFVIPQNAQELITDTGDIDGVLETTYIAALDATGIEDLFYGYNADDEATPSDVSDELLSLCLLWEQNGLEVMTTDYCSTHSKMDDSYSKNAQYGFISFAADERELNNIPDYPADPYNVNSDDVLKVSDAKNFLYLINNENFASKADFIDAVSATDYDLILIDLFFSDEQFTESEIAQLKIKSNGGVRIVICYMSIGEAEDYRYYWQADWQPGNPGWLLGENPDWAGNYKVKYWDPAWQDIIYGNPQSYLNRILDAGFDGVYLDIVDGYDYFL